MNAMVLLQQENATQTQCSWYIKILNKSMNKTLNNRNMDKGNEQTIHEKKNTNGQYIYEKCSILIAIKERKNNMAFCFHPSLEILDDF